MEALGSLATIVGLICNFKSERRASSDDEYKEFIGWLNTKQHKLVIEEIPPSSTWNATLKELFDL